MIGCVYCVVISSDTLFEVKIGMSRNINIKRSSSYGQTSKIIREVRCGNPKEVETQLIQSFNLGFTKVKGNEFFKGDYDQIIRCFDKCVSEYATEAIEYKLNTDQLIAKTDKWLSKNLDQGIIPSINDTLSFIRPDIEETISSSMMGCIDYLQSISDLSRMNHFIVNHDKLIEHNIYISSGGSSDIRKRLNALALCENVDYLKNKVKAQSHTSRGGRPQTIYMLTPRTFKRLILSSNMPVLQSYVLLEQYINQLYISRIYSHIQL